MRFDLRYSFLGITMMALLLGFTSLASAQFTTDWQRSVAGDNLPSWFGGNTERGLAYFHSGDDTYLLIASSAAFATTGSVRVVNAATGEDVGSLDLSGYTGTGTFVVSDVAVTDDGKIFVSNFGQNNFHPFRINMFDGINDDSPVEVLNDGINAGDTWEVSRAISVTGSYTAGTATIYAISTGGNNSVAIYSQTGPGEPFSDTPRVVALQTVGGTPHAAATGPGESTFYATGSGQPVTKYAADGTVIGSIPTEVVGTGAGKIKFLGSSISGDEFLAIFDFPTSTARLVNVVGGNPADAVALATSSPLGTAANANGTGDITARKNADGSVDIYLLATNNGIAHFSNEATILAPPPSIVSWSFDGTPSSVLEGPVTATDSNQFLTGTVDRGPGLTGTSLLNGFASNGFDAADFDAAVSGNKYYDIVVTAEGGYQFGIEAIEYNFRRSGSGPNAFQWAFSTDGTNFVNLGDVISYTESPTSGTAFGPFSTSAIEQLQGITEVTLRMYAWGASTSGGTGAFGRISGDDIVIRGSVMEDENFVPPTAPSEFVAQLSGLTEVPANLSAGTGTVNAVLSGDELVVTGSFSGLEGAYTMSHIHTGVAGTNGDVVFTLNADVDSQGNAAYVASSNTFTLTAEQVTALASGQYYINVHSDKFPAGEIRGQLLVDPNTAPTASAITAPADAAEITVGGFSSTPFVPTWTAATDADDDRVVYVWQLAADADFETVLLTVSTNTATSAELTMGAVDALLAENEIEVDAVNTFYHRVVSTDGSALTFGDGASVVITRGVVFDTFDIADVYDLENGTLVTVQGIVTRAVGNETRLQDETAGISTFGPSSSLISGLVASGELAKGDSVRITGEKSSFAGLTQINQIAEVTVLSRENPLPAPSLVTLAEIRDNGADYLSQLVRVEGLTINSTGTFSVNTTYEITDATEPTPGVVEFRTPNNPNTTIGNTTIPDRAFNYEGVIAVRNGVFRLYPQEATDIQLPALPLAGEYFIPQGSNSRGFETLGEAFAVLNEAGVSGAVTLYIAEDLDETESVLALVNVATSESNSITIMPAPEMTPTITVTGSNVAATESAGAGIAIYNTPWVTFDGSNDGSGDINMSIVYDGTAGANGVFSIIGSSSNVSVKNMSITYENASASATGIRVRRDNAATTVPVDLLFYNNIIGSFENPFKDGVALFGTGSPLLRVEAHVIDNDIYATHRGITTFFVDENIYHDNLIILTGEFENPAWYGGIYIAGAGGLTEVTANRIYTVGANFTTNGRYVAGIVVNLNADEVLIANNYISTSEDFENLGSATEYAVFGIAFQRGDGVEDYYIVHNSILTTEEAAADNRKTANIGYVGAGGFGAFQYLRNNIFVNEAGGNLYWPVTNVPTLNSNYNNFLSTGNLAVIGEDTFANLAAWQALGLDAKSVSHPVEFVSDVDLALTGSSLGDDMLRGNFVEFVPEDINGTMRNPGAPYMGAFESEVTLTDIEHSEEMPVAFALNQNFPNPFNPTTTISYQLPVETQVQLNVYTVTGQLVATLVNDVRSAGTHQVNFDASRLASGVYVYRIVAGDFIQTQKMTLIK
ncbi:MAG: CHRD domain-containing protein [Bacteroidetes bacterium]|nr:CHRD domain-containing protein [Bacteroidota bacterium]